MAVVPRDPMPPRLILMAAIARPIHLDRNAARDDALVRGSNPLGCRGSEIAAIRWQNIEVLSDGAQNTASHWADLPHQLRHSFAVHVVQMGVDVFTTMTGLLTLGATALCDLVSDD